MTQTRARLSRFLTHLELEAIFASFDSFDDLLDDEMSDASYCALMCEHGERLLAELSRPTRRLLARVEIDGEDLWIAYMDQSPRFTETSPDTHVRQG
jgi:hypothetical protein